ncbi:MAG: Na+/H+ antiporter NhaD/arsenite permease-like protein [Myxococcota bacterium]|jgi:Na+/H+ antiporter NhaD/arsenite permease-like protein
MLYSAAHTASVAGWQTALFGALLLGLIACLALEEKIHAKKSLIAGSFAVVCLLLAALMDLLPFGPVVNAFGEEMALPVYIPAVDWSVIAIILGSSIFVDVTSQSGLFTWIAIKLTRRSGGDPLILLWFYGLMTVVFSAVLNNVTAMIIVGSLSVVSLERLGRRNLLLGFLLIEGLLTNVGGLLTLISSVPNIIVGTAAGISFGQFLLVAAPYVVVATIITMVMGARRFEIRRLAPEEQAQAAELVDSFDENDGIHSQGFFIFGALMTGLFILTIASASVLPGIRDLGMGFVALAFAAIMLWRFKHEVDRFYRTVDWDLLGFFVALFIVINTMEHAQVLHVIGGGIQKVIGLGDTLGSGAMLVSAAVASSVTDNIPLAAMLAKILGQLGTATDSSLWWAVIFGANLGGNITPIGSASTLVAMTLIHKNKLNLSFAGFVTVAAPFAAVQITLAIAYVLAFLT